MTEQRTKAQWFREMHHDSSILILPNAWDVISARIFEAAGFSAVGTTSAGIAATLGYADGQNIPCDAMLSIVQRIVSRVQIPVTADIEAGYGATLEETVRNVDYFIEAGVVGINIEDSTSRSGERQESVFHQAEKIAAIRELSVTRAIPLVINARIDTIYHGGREPEELLEETFHRSSVYRQAGADCIYVFGFHDKATIRRLVEGIEAPLNILVGPTTPAVKELQELGVARVSIGPRAFLATLGLTKRIADELVTTGTYESFKHSSMSYQEMIGYFGGNGSV